MKIRSLYYPPRIAFSIMLIAAALSNVSLKRPAHVLEIKIDCDSVFTAKGLSVRHILNPHVSREKPNSIFIFQKNEGGKITQIFRDTLSSQSQKILFVDYNGDKVKDILVQHASDVRSNWSYYLYLVDPKTFTLTKVEGFEQIKAPKYNAKHNLVTNYVNSGKNWSSFYKIANNKIHDYGLIIYDAENEKGQNTYEKDFNEALRKIKSKK